MKAVLLCAGFGTRLKDLTKDLPKALLKINKKTIIEFQLEQLKAVGIVEVYINLHHCAEQIKNYLGDGARFGVNIHYHYESEPSGTAGGARCFQKFLEEDDFIVMYGDIVTKQPLSQLIEKHKTSKADATLFVHKRKKSNSIIEVNDSGAITTFLERPNPETLEKFKDRETWVNSAIYCLSSSIFKYFKPTDVLDFPKDIFPAVLDSQKLYALPISEMRFAIDSVEKLNEAIEFFKGDF